MIMRSANLLEHMARSIYQLVVSFDGKPLLVVHPHNEQADLSQVLQVLSCQAMLPGPEIKESVCTGEPASMVKWSNDHYLEAVWD